MISATVSMIAKVMRYWTSLTAKESSGGTKKKSNAASARKEVAMAGPRPKRTPTSTTASRYTIATFTSSNCGLVRAPSAVQSAVAAAPQA